ncbi:hypothetical protein NQZ68_031118 [Dissostichus eleginoides]|nr:hypothetical protein NQZ68_031118 [Dissostichus eleginoides]
MKVMKPLERRLLDLHDITVALSPSSSTQNQIFMTDEDILQASPPTHRKPSPRARLSRKKGCPRRWRTSNGDITEKQ